MVDSADVMILTTIACLLPHALLCVKSLVEGSIGGKHSNRLDSEEFHAFLPKHSALTGKLVSLVIERDNWLQSLPVSKSALRVRVLKMFVVQLHLSACKSKALSLQPNLDTVDTQDTHANMSSPTIRN